MTYITVILKVVQLKAPDLNLCQLNIKKTCRVFLFLFCFCKGLAPCLGDLFTGWRTMPSISSAVAQMCNRFPCRLDFHVVLKQNINEAAPPHFSCDNILFLLSTASVACSVLRWIEPVFNSKER